MIEKEGSNVRKGPMWCHKVSSRMLTPLGFSTSRGSVSLISHSEFNVGVRHGVRAEAIIGMENTDDDRIRSWPSPNVILAADCTKQTENYLEWLFPGTK